MPTPRATASGGLTGTAPVVAGCIAYTPDVAYSNWAIGNEAQPNNKVDAEPDLRQYEVTRKTLGWLQDAPPHVEEVLARGNRLASFSVASSQTTTSSVSVSEHTLEM